eukprot:g20322.t1
MRSNGLLVSAVLCVGTFTLTHLAFVGPATGANAPKVARAARGGGEYDISDADIQNFYNSLLTGAGGDPPKGTAQMANPMFVTKGGVGYGVDETQKVEDDGKGWALMLIWSQRKLPLACYHVDLTAWSLPNLKLYCAVDQLATQDFEAASTVSKSGEAMTQRFLQWAWNITGLSAMGKAGGVASVWQTILIGTVYIVTSSTLISFNKFLMQPGRFSHAVHLTAFHMVVTLVLSLIFYKVAPQYYPSMGMAKANITQVAKWIAPLGFLFALALYCSNQAYKYSSVMGGAGLKLDVLTFVLFQAPFSLLFLAVGVFCSWTPDVVSDFKKQNLS